MRWNGQDMGPVTSNEFEGYRGDYGVGHRAVPGKLGPSVSRDVNEMLKAHAYRGMDAIETGWLWEGEEGPVSLSAWNDGLRPGQRLYGPLTCLLGRVPGRLVGRTSEMPERHESAPDGRSESVRERELRRWQRVMDAA